jgi:hypothetical protein
MPFSMSCPPRYATRRRAERETFGPELAAIADKLGQPLMPWQRLVADVGGEISELTGLPAYREVVVTVPRQSGKALDCATPILTGNRGWATMGELRVGDTVFHPGGHVVAVTFVSDVQTGHDCFRVTTVDGRSVVADADHLWTVTDKRAERSRGTRKVRETWFEQRIATTREMYDGGLSRYASGGRTSHTDGKAYATNEYRYVLPIQEPLKSPDVDLPLDPYLLGGWLGDGTSAGGRLTCHVSEVAHWSATIEAAGFIPTSRQGGGTIDTWSVSMTTTLGPGRKSRAFAGQLRRFGLLHNKHVPALYLTAGASQREAILQGLLDTDGTIDAARGQVEFCSTTLQLAEDVLFLARSLGWRATLRTGRAMLRGHDHGPKYRVCFTPKRSDPFVPFRLERKAARVRDRDGNKGRNTVSVVSVEPVDSVPVRCIKVDSPDGLFLAGRDLMPTHNTTLFLSWQINRCVSRRWKHPQRSVFTAQTGKDARDKWIDELFPLIRNSPLKALVAAGHGGLAINEGMGNESVLFKTGSRIRLLSTSTSSGHSKTLHQAVMDEVWHDTDDRREQGLRPAMITNADAQLLVCSTAGTEDSLILNRKVAAGRAAALADSGAGVAYFEWSAPGGDDWDLNDEDSYFEFMPALCPDPPCRCAGSAGGWRHTITSLDAIRAERDSMEPAEFRRAYGNVKTGNVVVNWGEVAEAQWSDAYDADSTATGPVALSIDVMPQTRDQTCISAVGARLDGDLHGEVIDRRPGTDWVVARAMDLVDKWDVCAISLVGTGAAFTLHPELVQALKQRQSLLEIKVMTNREVAAAFGMTVDAIKAKPGARRLRWRCAAEYVKPLTDAVKGGVRREIGEGSAWDRPNSAVDIAPIISLTNAVHTFVSTDVPPPVAVANPGQSQQSSFFRPAARLRL